MATVVRDIIAGGGGDYTTIAAWETATNLNSGADIWKGEIADNSAYDESVVFDVDGTSTTSYVWLSTASANRHAGISGTGHGRVTYTGTGNAALIASASDYLRISDLEVHRTAAGMGTGDEGIRVNDADNALLQYLILWTDETSAINNDGVATESAFDNTAKTLSIDNCAIYGWNRAGVNTRFMDGSGALNIDHCTIVYNGDGSLAHTAPTNYTGNLQCDDAIGTVSIYNNNFATMINLDSATWDHNIANVPNTGGTLQGSHNAAEADANVEDEQFTTNTASSWQFDASGTTDSTAATAFIVTDFTGITTFDFTPVDDANNSLLDNGTDRQGSEPDSRQDFSIDLAGETRPTTGVTIGAIQLASSSAAAPQYWRQMSKRRNWS
jgi:hypothetical protein